MRQFKSRMSLFSSICGQRVGVFPCIPANGAYVGFGYLFRTLMC